MAGIFINYRRDDAPGVAGRLFDYLATKFSRDDLFMDVDAMKPAWISPSSSTTRSRNAACCSP
jgi:hypothetical protein